ncbi:hypothetical protein PABG_06698 [Paracoccidioides brasiliensis Pb03]|nr:hypothetical protein PABG_06698 [Paracoccidioides brasiliensis Pb03]
MVPKNEVYLEFAVVRLRDIFNTLHRMGPVIRDLKISTAIPDRISTTAFVIAFLDWAISPRSIAGDLIRVLERVDVNVMEEDADTVMHKLTMKNEAKEAVVSWARFWCLNLLFPMMDRQLLGNLPEYWSIMADIRHSVMQRDSNRCPVTGIYDTFTATNVEPQGTLAAVHIIPPRISYNKTAKTLISKFTGGQILPEHLSPENIDAMDNTLMLSTTISTLFEQYRWSICPERQGNPRFSFSVPGYHEEEHSYRLRKVADFYPPNTLSAPEDSRILFGRGPPEGGVFVLPNPSYLRLHYSLALILEATQAGKTISRIQHAMMRSGLGRRALVFWGDEMEVFLPTIYRRGMECVLGVLQWYAEEAEAKAMRQREKGGG